MESNNSNHNQQRSLSYSLPTLLMLASEESHMSKVPAKPRPKPKKKFNGVRSGEGVGFGVCERCHRELKKRGCKYIFEGNAIFACGSKFYMQCNVHRSSFQPAGSTTGLMAGRGLLPPPKRTARIQYCLRTASDELEMTCMYHLKPVRAGRLH